jgi:hypothetical protein
MAGNALGDQLPEDAAEPPAVPAEEVLVQPRAAAMVTPTQVTRVVVAPKGLDQRPRDRRAQRQPDLLAGQPDGQFALGGRVGIEGIEPFGEITEGGEEVVRHGRHGRDGTGPPRPSARRLRQNAGITWSAGRTRLPINGRSIAG